VGFGMADGAGENLGGWYSGSAAERNHTELSG